MQIVIQKSLIQYNYTFYARNSIKSKLRYVGVISAWQHGPLYSVARVDLIARTVDPDGISAQAPFATANILQSTTSHLARLFETPAARVCMHEN